MDAASRRAILVRCGDRSTSGVLLEGPQDERGADGIRGAFVLVPAVVLLGAEDFKKDVVAVEEIARRAPPMTVLLRRGLVKAAGGGGAGSAPGAGRRREPQLDELAEAPARLVAAWRWAALAEALPELLAELTLSRDESAAPPGAPKAIKAGQDSSADSDGWVRNLLSVFLVLQVQPVPDHAPALRAALRRVAALVPDVPARGRPVCAACAPLGAPGLLGAVSRGVVSGRASLLALTDARVAPGSEGAAVYPLDADDAAPGLPCAVVLSPLTWWRGEAVGFTLCLPLGRLLCDALLDLSGAPPAAPLTTARHAADSEDPDLYGLDRSVVLVRAGCSWGSGVVVGDPADDRKRLVLTCAHVVKGGEEVSVRWARRSARASVLWRAAEGAPFDLAVLRLDDDRHLGDLVPLPVDSGPPHIGEPVLAAGFPLFSERSWPSRCLRPLVTRGSVGGWWPGAPSQVLTTCCVQSGNSGGPLLRVGGARPTVIGVLVCTATTGTDQDAVVHPHVNFALCADAFQRPVDEYFATGDKRAFEKINLKSDGAARKQWKLYPPAISKL